MRNKNMIILFALAFSLVFTLFYLSVFHVYIPSKATQSTTLYMNQIGLYKEEENANKVMSALKEQGVEAYIYAKDDVYAIVSGVGEEEKIASENGEKLKTLSYSYITKKVKVSDEQINACIEDKDYQKALEMIAHQSKGTS